MTVTEMVDFLFEQVNTGRLKMSDQIPDDILHGGESGINSKTVAEYVAQKYNIRAGGDTDGQEDT